MINIFDFEQYKLYLGKSNFVKTTNTMEALLHRQNELKYTMEASIQHSVLVIEYSEFYNVV